MTDRTDKRDSTEEWAGYSGGHTWMESDLPVARRIGRPVRHFMHVETAGGFVLLAATVAALVLANTAAGDPIHDFFQRELTLIEFGDFHLRESLEHWINDGLMAIFFFVVGLEIKRELVDGELKDPRRAALPAIAALGGMIVPAGIYVIFNAGGAGADGWGIPMATDIAFAVGVMALLGSKVPSPVKVFLLTLAIVDDIGAILVIAIFYSDGISWAWLATAGTLVVAMIAMRLARIWYVPAYVVVGVCVWVATLESGVHATIAGVLLGLLTPAKALRPSPNEIAVAPSRSWETMRSTVFDAKESLPVAERLQNLIHPWSAFVILPLFAFANAGIELSGDSIKDAASSAVTAGVVLGLVVGKPLGIVIAAWLAEKAGIGDRPDGVNWRHIGAAGALAGIGFTVSLFVTGLAFDDPAVIDEAKIGIVVASILAAGLGAAMFAVGDRTEAGHQEVDAEAASSESP